MRLSSVSCEMNLAYIYLSSLKAPPGFFLSTGLICSWKMVQYCRRNSACRFRIKTSLSTSLLVDWRALRNAFSMIGIASFVSGLSLSTAWSYALKPCSSYVSKFTPASAISWRCSLCSLPCREPLDRCTFRIGHSIVPGPFWPVRHATAHCRNRIWKKLWMLDLGAIDFVATPQQVVQWLLSCLHRYNTASDGPLLWFPNLYHCKIFGLRILFGYMSLRVLSLSDALLQLAECGIKPSRIRRIRQLPEIVCRHSLVTNCTTKFGFWFNAGRFLRELGGLVLGVDLGLRHSGCYTLPSHQVRLTPH